MRRDGVGWDGMGWDGMGWDRTRWDRTRQSVEHLWSVGVIPNSVARIIREILVDAFLEILNQSPVEPVPCELYLALLCLQRLCNYTCDGMGLHGMGWDGMTLPSICGAVRCGAVRCGAVRRGAVRCSAARCGAMRCSAVWLPSISKGALHPPPTPPCGHICCLTMAL